MQFLCFILALTTTSVVATADFSWDDHTALDSYVFREDGYWNYVQMAEYRYENVSCTTYIFNMTSQKWQDESLVSRSVWWHWMGVSVPDNLKHSDFAAMLVDGGSNREGGSPPSQDALENFATCLLADSSGAVMGYIKNVPNQPAIFTNDPDQKSRSEDSLIAWTWKTFVDAYIANSTTADPEVIMRMAMTKAAKRGLDTIEAVVREKFGHNIDRFMVTGASKRGWTTYSLAAVDKRVTLIAPIVFSLLNAPETVMAHYRSMDGAYSFALAPYYNEGLTEYLLDDDIFGPLFETEDLYSYRNRYQDMPLIQIVATGDEFFLCTDSHHWWDTFPAKKYMMMNQNAEHALLPSYIRIAETVVGWIVAYLEEWELPTVSWTRNSGPTSGEIVMTATPPAKNVTGWRSTTLDNGRRDWRLVAGWPEPALQPAWWFRRTDVTEEDISENTRRYTASTELLEGEENFWVGFFIQGEWEGPTGLRMFMTTEVDVIPSETYPREPCETGEECKGHLV